jgi:hypothetical protein
MVERVSAGGCKGRDFPSNVVTHRDRQRDSQFVLKLPDLIDRVIETRIHGDHRKIRPGILLRVRHLCATGNAPGCPKFQIDGRLAVERTEVDRRAVNGRQDDRGANDPIRSLPAAYASSWPKVSARIVWFDAIPVTSATSRIQRNAFIESP